MCSLNIQCGCAAPVNLVVGRLGGVSHLIEMAYTLAIQSPLTDDEDRPIPIPLEEWKMAVSLVARVRLSSEPSNLAGPDGATRITIPHRDGDVQVLDAVTGEWRHVFRWLPGGYAVFNARVLDHDDSGVVWQAATELARQLGGVIVGDDGERYDLLASKLTLLK
jgi:hypothetical protein